MSKRLSRKEVRSLSMQGLLEKETHNLTSKFYPRSIIPKTQNQAQVFESYLNEQNLFLYGYAGTGKTFLSLYLSIRDVLDHHYKKLVIVRSAVPTRDVGFLPGKQEEKMAVYEAPYVQICADLFRKGDAYELLKKQMVLEFVPTSFVRGTTINDAIVLIDECQNMNDHEINSVVTRLGDNSKLIMCGDIRQSDLVRESSGFHQTLDIFSRMKSIDMIEFGIKDIVRSGFVKDYIIAKEELKDENIQTRSGNLSETQEGHYRWQASLPKGGSGRVFSLSVSNDCS